MFSEIPFEYGMTAEDICLKIAVKLSIGSIAFPLFGLRDAKDRIWLAPNSRINCVENSEQLIYQFRCRYKPSVENFSFLMQEESDAMFYYFLQCRRDFVNGEFRMTEAKVNGNGLLDCIRVMYQQGISDAAQFFKKYKLKYFLPARSLEVYFPYKYIYRNFLYEMYLFEST